MNNFKSTNVYKRCKTAILIGAIAAPAFFLPSWYATLLIMFVGIVVLIQEWPTICSKYPHFWILTPFYPILPFLLLMILNHCNNGPFWLFLLILICWSFDTGSYFVGSLIGKHLLCPSISPGKTWEGVFGGIAVSIIVIKIYFWFLLAPTSTVFLLLLVLYIGFFALLGDLFESFIKRKAQLKDSGTLLAGHGGLLDRFDSVLIAVIGLYILFWLAILPPIF